MHSSQTGHRRQEQAALTGAGQAYPGSCKAPRATPQTSSGRAAPRYRELPRLLDPARLPPAAPAAPPVVGRMLRSTFTKSARWSSAWIHTAASLQRAAGREGKQFRPY